MTSTHPFGWAGLILDVPDAYRPMQIDGTMWQGRFVLGDDERVRLNVQWATNRSRRFKPDKFVRNRAVSVLARVERKREIEKLVAVEHPCYSPMVRYDDAKRNVTRWVGYCDATKRAVDVVYYNGSKTEDDAFARDVLPTLRDQPVAQPQRWAVFDFRFTAPEGFTYSESQLNLGDMEVVFTDAKRTCVRIRQIHPARLALARQPLEKWLSDLTVGQRNRYLPPHVKKIHPIDCALGDAFGCDAKLRPGLKMTMWRTPWVLRWRVIHDAPHDRLIALAVAARRKAHDEIADAWLDGLHW